MSGPLECRRFGLRHSEMVMAFGMRPSCARFDSWGRLSLRNPWTGETPVATPARANFGAVMGVTVFCEIRIPIPGPVDAAITMETLSEPKRLLQ
jgi:hypothetical protein